MRQQAAESTCRSMARARWAAGAQADGGNADVLLRDARIGGVDPETSSHLVEERPVLPLE